MLNDDPSQNSSLLENEIPKVIPGGYFWELFMPEISPFYQDQYSCSICYLVLRDPYKCQNNHLFCKSCLHNWIMTDNKRSLECPVCRDVGPFLEDSKIKSELENHPTACMANECPWVGKLSEYGLHNHGRIEAEGRQVPDLSKTINHERLKKERADDFITEDRIVSMMSVIYADIEHRRRRIENIRLGRNDYTNDQLGDIQLLHDRLLSLRRNIDTFFGQSDSYPLWTRITHVPSNSEVSSGPASEVEAYEPVEFVHASPEFSEVGDRGDMSSLGDVPSFSSEFELSDGNSDILAETEMADLIYRSPSSLDCNLDEINVPGNEEALENVEKVTPTVQTSIPRPISSVSESMATRSQRSQAISPSSALSSNSTAASRLRYNYLSRRFNFGSRESEPADTKRRKLH
ncbi:uncharacterized protein LOC115229281 [Octopus sinensis]|uniref:Uncharacterized protein LOC115229281 n=1 Tax=Octopus sinensis TaxID=2607531 RepID=A0A6P7U3N0_9MOLL|nr:uncharacterized protein LOC115229281 [Octopus sinensis]